MANFSHNETVKAWLRAWGRYPHEEGKSPSEKSTSRKLQKQVEFEAGKEEALRARERRLINANKRQADTGSPIPKNTTSPRGAERVFSRDDRSPFKQTVAHTGVRSVLASAGLVPEEITTEQKTTLQSRKSNYGKRGQGAATVPEWKRRLRKQGYGVFSDNPIELDTNKTRVQKREIKTYGPAPRVGRAAGFTGRLPVVASPANLLMEFLMANKENRPMDPFKALTGLSMSGPPGYGVDPRSLQG